MNGPQGKPAARKVTGRCPVCGNPAAPERRPFCSKRCADIDLGRWLNGAYVVPGEPVGNIDDASLDEEWD